MLFYFPVLFSKICHNIIHVTFEFNPLLSVQTIHGYPGVIRNIVAGFICNCVMMQG